MLFETSQSALHPLFLRALAPLLQSVNMAILTYLCNFLIKKKDIAICMTLLHFLKHGINLDTPSYMNERIQLQ